QVDAGEGALRVGKKARPNAVPHPLVLRLDEPVASVLELLDARREQPPFRRRGRPPGGRPGPGIDVVFARGEPLAVVHGTLLVSMPLAKDSYRTTALPATIQRKPRCSAVPNPERTDVSTSGDLP